MAETKAVAELEIVGGRVVTPEGVIEADLIVRDGRIAEIAPAGGRRSADAIDAHGCYLIPGGVDPHSHALSDLEATSRAAAYGGTTTILTFTLPRDGEPPLDALLRAGETSPAVSVVDLGLHASYLDPASVPPELLVALRSAGARGVQVFLAFPELGLMFDDAQLYRVLRDAAPLGLPVQVQCENGTLVEALTQELIASGRTAVPYYPLSRPAGVEEEAVSRTLAIAALADAPVYLVHLSTGEAVASARAARARGTRVAIEVCTHHLILDERAYGRPDGDRFIVGPPLRATRDVEALWEAIRHGTVDAVGSDHAQIPRGAASPQDSFLDAPMGLPGIELRVPLVLSEGRRRGIPLETLVDVLAAGPARAFGLYPRKGALAVGSDADIVVWDPAPDMVVRAAQLHDGLGYTPYEGRSIHGAVRMTLLRGQSVVRDHTLLVEPGYGHLV